MGNHQRVGIMKLHQWGILKGSIPYRIIRRLMLLKVLHKPPRPIRVYMPKEKGEWDELFPLQDPHMFHKHIVNVNDIIENSK